VGMDAPAHPLTSFHPLVRNWFTETLGEPSAPQRAGWPAMPVETTRHPRATGMEPSGLSVWPDGLITAAAAPLPLTTLNVSPFSCGGRGKACRQ
jgi:hypothetical protein